MMGSDIGWEHIAVNFKLEYNIVLTRKLKNDKIGVIFRCKETGWSDASSY